MRAMISLAVIGMVVFVVGIIGFYSVEMFSTGYYIFSNLLISGFLTALMSSVSALFLYEK